MLQSYGVIIMKIVLEQVCLLIAFAAVGYTLSKTKIADSKHSKLLSVLCLYIFLPAKVFNTFATRFTPEYLSAKYPLLVVAAVVVAAMALISIPLSRLLTKDGYQRSVLQYSLTIPNYGYIGYALAEGIFGGEVLLDVMMFAFPLCLYNYTVSYCMLTKSKGSLKKLFNPVTMAMVLGAAVGLLGIDLPQIADTFLSKASACMSPASMLLTGMVISDYKLKDLLSRWQIYVVVALRLLVIPCTVALSLRLLALDTLVIPALMVMAMPCGLNTIVFPKLIGEDCKIGASLAFVSSILCCATIPLCLLLFGNGVI